MLNGGPRKTSKNSLALQSGFLPYLQRIKVDQRAPENPSWLSWPIFKC